uniref:Putative retrotransposon protein n=1 Tax=Tanacetum cinerariifolium TaxID=118510 RepID=A0A6L2MH27_TANCI|nr:putative retrotransposon protein [Tanacetum cinerariifolium]
MVTCSPDGTTSPTQRLNLHVSSISPSPKSYREAFNDPNWQNVMRDEYNALIKTKLGLVVKPDTIQIVLSLDASRHTLIHQLDVKIAFLHDDLSEMVYMHQPPRFRDSAHPDHACLLHRSLYGLKQAPEHGFSDLHLISLMLIFIIVVLQQNKYDVEILERVHLVNCNPSQTLVDTESKLGVDGDPVSDPTLYRNLAGSLQYLTFTRMNISYGTLDYGLQLFASFTNSLVANSDADWAGCHTTRQSTSDYCVFLGNNLLSWSSKRQPMLSRSTVEAEYRSVADAVAKTLELVNLKLRLIRVKSKQKKEETPCLTAKASHIQEQDSHSAESSSSIGLTTAPKMVINSPCLNSKKELAIPEQTATVKESTNPLMADSLPKTIMPTKLVKPQENKSLNLNKFSESSSRCSSESRRKAHHNLRRTLASEERTKIRMMDSMSIDRWLTDSRRPSLNEDQNILTKTF